MVLPNLDSQNPLAEIFNFLTWPFNAIGGLLGLGPIPSPFEEGVALGLLPTPGDAPMPAFQLPSPLAPIPVPPVSGPGVRIGAQPAPNPYAGYMFAVYDSGQNYWFYITPQQHDVLLASPGGYGAFWEDHGLVAPGATP